MTTRASVIDLRRARMDALGLGSHAGRGGVGADSEPQTDGPVAVVEHLLAMQAQDLPQAMWALAVRMGPAVDVADAAGRIREACDRGLIVRSWPMRGTVHLTAAADIGWMQQLAGPRVLAGWPKRRDYQGLTIADYARAEELARQLLASGG
ncbi:MAG: DNA glycosylase AlkZ-like family protein, partial [Mycetocola sp.]